jgi:hypothetical protein
MSVATRLLKLQQRLLSSAPVFHPSSLRIVRMDDSASASSFIKSPNVNMDTGVVECEEVPTRRYTMTHDDRNGALRLSVGSDFNREQMSGWYQKVMKDEVLAEWVVGSVTKKPELHVYCRVSGYHVWPASPQVRNYIFQREMSLVLQSINHAEKELRNNISYYSKANVYVHMVSDVSDLNCEILWGQLQDASTWEKANWSQLGVWDCFMAAMYCALTNRITHDILDDSTSARRGVMDDPASALLTIFEAGIAYSTRLIPCGILDRFGLDNFACFFLSTALPRRSRCRSVVRVDPAYTSRKRLHETFKYQVCLCG